jgi:hypothetical protein
VEVFNAGSDNIAKGAHARGTWAAGARSRMGIAGPASVFAPGHRWAQAHATDMSKEEFYERFSLEEWELLCSKREFLNVLAAEPFDAEMAETVAHRILKVDSPAYPLSFAACGPEVENQAHSSPDAPFLCLATHSIASPAVFPGRVRRGHGPPLRRRLR